MAIELKRAMRQHLEETRLSARSKTTATGSDSAPNLAALSSALVPVFRGKFCDVLLPNRNTVTFAEDDVIYDMGDKERTFFFIRRGVVKTGTITESGREIIYDIRKDGDVVGELCALEPARLDRAVALEQTQAIAVAFDEVIATLAAHPTLLGDFVGIFCNALSEAYGQVNRLAVNDVLYRLVDVLKTLAHKFGRPSDDRVEIAIYLTQEDLAQMVVARRERVSTALNALRRRGIALYSPRGHLLIDLKALENIAPE